MITRSNRQSGYVSSVPKGDRNCQVVMYTSASVLGIIRIYECINFVSGCEA